MPFAFVERPSIFLVRRVGAASPEDTTDMMVRLRRMLAAASSPCAAVYDAGHDPAGRPDSRSRQIMATWLSDNEALLRKRSVGIDCAFPNPLSRGVLTAILWLKTPPVEIRVHGDVSAAVASAVNRLPIKLDARELLNALDDAVRARH